MSTVGTESFHSPLHGPLLPLRLFVFSHPRTVSNLFCKLFTEHPKIDYHEYPFLNAYFSGPEAQVVDKTDPRLEEAVKALSEKFKPATFQFVIDKLERDIAQAEVENKVPMFKDHCHLITQASIIKDLSEKLRDIPPKPKMEDNFLDVPEDSRARLIGIPYHDLTSSVQNPTVLPDRLMKTLAPVLMIRHPAKQVGSLYKASRTTLPDIDSAAFELSTSYKYSRMVFDYFKCLYKQSSLSSSQDKSRWPIVVDGDDLINDTEGVISRFCAITGLDSTGVIYKWDKSEPSDPLEALFKGTLNASNGVLKNESPETPSIQKEMEKWKHNWGDEVANKLAQYAEKAIDDYQYLYRYSL